MAAGKPKRIGSKVGKHPQKAVRVALTGSKYDAGGSVIKKKRGGYIRRPKPPIRYRKPK
jgi:hypothetical protein